MPLFTFLPTDAVIWALAAVLLWAVLYIPGKPAAARWKRVFSRQIPQAAAVLLAAALLTALADSVHFRPRLGGEEIQYAPASVSLLDETVGLRIAGRERSYSAPFAVTEFDKTGIVKNDRYFRDFAPLKGTAPGISSSRERNSDVARRTAKGLFSGTAATALLFLALVFFGRKKNEPAKTAAVRILSACKGAVLAAASLIFLVSLLLFLWDGYHPFGTDKTGNDVLYQAVKSLRTAFVLGTLSTAAMLPFAVTLGIAAGFFKGKTDDIVQYVYTTISSIPSILLIAASALMIQVFIDQHPALLPTALERADAKLFSIAVIIGITGWAGLARLLRAETMKISSLDYITAARACGTSEITIMRRHVLPNVLHIILIVSVIGFSDIVLYEAVLSYIGVGVDPSMNSFGSMINAARTEMARTPAVWWNLSAAFVFMVAVVLSANLFASAVRDAFDPSASIRGKRK